MHSTFRYRLYPTQKQKKLLQDSLDACRWVYNETLATRKEAYEARRESLTLYDTYAFIPKWKKNNFELCNAQVQSLRDAQLRIDLAFKAFFRRVKAGEKPGYPRFKGYGHYDSFAFPQPTIGYEPKNDKIKIFRVGRIKIKQHRPIKGKVKTLTIRRTVTGKWFACYSCETGPKPLRPSKATVGVDVGLESFATLSTGKKIANPRFFRTGEKALKKAQQKLSKADKGSKERGKRRKVVAYVHEKIANKRKDFAHKQSLALVKKYGFIAFEKLDVKEMREDGFKGIRKSIGDVAWCQFMQFTTYKAESAGRVVVFVDPRNTSKRCSRCGQLVEKKLSERVHRCPCGLVMDRDKNAAINILALGLQGVGSIPKSPRL